MRPVALVLTLIAVVLPACGGSDDDGGLTRDEYIERADAICARINANVGEINADARGARSIEQLRPVLDRALALYDEGIAELERLDPPAEIEADAERFLDVGREQRRLLASAREARTLQETAPVFQRELPRVVRERDAAARAIGFERCGGQG